MDRTGLLSAVEAGIASAMFSKRGNQSPSPAPVSKQISPGTTREDSKPLTRRALRPHYNSSDPTLTCSVMLLNDDSPLTEVIKREILEFSRSVRELELPLYLCAYIQLQKCIDELIQLCHEDGPSSVHSPPRRIKEIFTHIRKLFPGLLATESLYSAPLVELLLDIGALDNIVKDFEGIEKDILKSLSIFKDSPLPLLKRVCDTLFQNNEFIKAFLLDQPECILKINTPGVFEYWLEQLNAHTTDFHQTSSLYLNALQRAYNIPEERMKKRKWNEDLIEAIFNNKLYTEEINSILEYDYTVPLTADERNTRDDKAFPLLRLLMVNTETVSRHLKTLFKRLTPVQHNQLLIGFYMIGYTSVLKLLLEVSPNISFLINWRDLEGRTILHHEYFRNLYEAEPADNVLSPLMINHSQELVLLLTAHDHRGITALASHFTNGHSPIFIYKKIEDNPFIQLIDKSIQNDPCQPETFYETLRSLTDFNMASWLLIRFVQNGFNPNPLMGSYHQDIPLTPFATNFMKLLCEYKPLDTQERQAGFLTMASRDPRCYLACHRILSQSFQPEARPAIHTAPFNNDETWTSESYPLPSTYISGQALVTGLDWYDDFETAFHCYIPAERSQILDLWTQAQKHQEKQPDLVTFLKPLPLGEHGLYGRSCFFKDTEGGKTLRLKFKKKCPAEQTQAEPWETFASEPVKLDCLRKLQQSGDLPLKSNLPEPIGMFRIPDFQTWLSESPLSNQEQKALEDCVFIESDGSVCVYAYTTNPSEHYHLYPYDTESVGFESALESLNIAAHDLGVLARAGLAATVLPMYHSMTQDRHYVILAQLCDKVCPGALESWDAEATDHPNISPGVGIRDYADIEPLSELPLVLEYPLPDTPDNRKKMHMEQISREFFSLILLLARTWGHRLNHNDNDAVDTLADNILQITTNFFSKAFDLPEELIANAMTTYGIPHRLSLEISYWCDHSEYPDWAKNLKQGAMSARVYPQKHKNTFAKSLSEDVTDRGAYVTTHSKGRQLGYRNGPLPIMELHKLITLAFNLSVFKKDAEDEFST